MTAEHSVESNASVEGGDLATLLRVTIEVSTKSKDELDYTDKNQLLNKNSSSSQLNASTGDSTDKSTSPPQPYWTLRELMAMTATQLLALEENCSNFAESLKLPE